MSIVDPAWGPIGREVFDGNYRRPKIDGSFESFAEAVERMVDGNLALVDPRHIEKGERDYLLEHVFRFDVVPGWCHWWATGIPGRQFLSNCYTIGWNVDDVTEHPSYLFDLLMQGSGVGSNYSNRYIQDLPTVAAEVDFHIVCNPGHADYGKMNGERGLLSTKYVYGQPGAYAVGDSREAWCEALELLMRAHWCPHPDFAGKPLVFDVSNIRCEGAPLRTFGGRASGPAPLVEMLLEVNALLNARVGQKLSSIDWMKIDHGCGSVVVSGGVRRTARMSQKSWRDSDIGDFIVCKREDGAHWSTNVSVEIDDEFLAKLAEPGSIPSQIHRMVVEGMIANGEPGYWNIDHARRGDPEPHLMFSTNACGEHSGPAYSNCNLGHVNVQHVGFDSDAFRYMTRFLLRATFGDFTREHTNRVAKRDRRIGVGMMGFANWLSLAGVPYSKAPKKPWVRQSLRRSKEVVKEAAWEYAHKLRIPAPATCTTVAPTGTTSLMPGVSSGIQPIYARYFHRRVRYSEDDPALADVAERGYPIEKAINERRTMVATFACEDPILAKVVENERDPDVVVQDQGQLSLSDFLSAQALVQEEYLDNGCSFTVNLNPERVPDLEDAMGKIAAMLPRLRGLTVMVDETREQAPFERLTKEEYRDTDVPKMEAIAETACGVNGCPMGQVGTHE